MTSLEHSQMLTAVTEMHESIYYNFLPKAGLVPCYQALQDFIIQRNFDKNWLREIFLSHVVKENNGAYTVDAGAQAALNKIFGNAEMVRYYIGFNLLHPNSGMLCCLLMEDHEEGLEYKKLLRQCRTGMYKPLKKLGLSDTRAQQLIKTFENQVYDRLNEDKKTEVMITAFRDMLNDSLSSSFENIEKQLSELDNPIDFDYLAAECQLAVSKLGLKSSLDDERKATAEVVRAQISDEVLANQTIELCVLYNAAHIHATVVQLHSADRASDLDYQNSRAGLVGHYKSLEETMGTSSSEKDIIEQVMKFESTIQQIPQRKNSAVTAQTRH